LKLYKTSVSPPVKERSAVCLFEIGRASLFQWVQECDAWGQ
jgi:hypothetical protein